MRYYGPEFREILVPRRCLQTPFVATVHAWDVPKGLQERLESYWTMSDEQKAGPHTV